MSCNISTAPINISSAINVPCTTGCTFTYDYGDGGSPSVTNKTTYLDITCWSNVQLGGDIMSNSAQVSSVRLYAPSLNSFDGFKADAEIIITHKLSNNSNVYVCVPITSSEKTSSSAKWFRKIIPFSPTKKNASTQIINATNISLNDIIPTASYLVYEGGSFAWGCNKNDKMIIFNKNVAINMKQREYKTLRSLIDRASYNINEPGTELLFVENGTKQTGNRPGGNRTMTCEPITFPDGTPIIKQSVKDLLPHEGSSSLDVDIDGIKPKMTHPLSWVLAVIIGILLIILLIYAVYSVTKERKSLSASGGRGSG